MENVYFIVIFRRGDVRIQYEQYNFIGITGLYFFPHKGSEVLQNGWT